MRALSVSAVPSSFRCTAYIQLYTQPGGVVVGVLARTVAQVMPCLVARVIYQTNQPGLSPRQRRGPRALKSERWEGQFNQKHGMKRETDGASERQIKDGKLAERSTKWPTCDNYTEARPYPPRTPSEIRNFGPLSVSVGPETSLTLRDIQRIDLASLSGTAHAISARTPSSR